ncbi:MAG: PhnD/SsuA/transferrin family substrate-binding protein [Terracidiphilus sp.]
MTRRESLTRMAAAVAVACAPKLCRAVEEIHPLRLAISVDTLAGANVNDARAAYMVWLRQVSSHYGIQSAVLVPEVFVPSEVLIRYVRQNLIDAYGITALELAKLVEWTDPDSLILQDYLIDGMEYVLLVHGNSHINAIADLRNGRIVSHLHRDMVLSPVWLGTLLAANNLPQPDHFFAEQMLNDKVNQVVLPVFFRRADAACLARRDWEMAVELNPQLGRDLHALAVSPKLIPIAMGFRRSTSADARKALIESIQKISSFTAGQQIVALYQSRAFAVRPIAAMKTTLDLVHQYERVSAQQPAARKGQL